MNSRTAFVVLILGIWLCCAIAAIFTKQTDQFGAAAFVTLCAGLAYALR